MYEITPVHEFPGTTHTRAREIIENFQPRLHRVIIRSFVDAPTETVFDRSFNYRKLLWLEQGADFQLAVEAKIPDEIRKAMSRS